MTNLILCDTGVISRFLTSDKLVLNKVIALGIENICISIITKIELFNWLSNNPYLDKKQRNQIFKLINNFYLVHINENISKIANDYAIKNINSKHGDILIGSTAKYHKIPLFTLNLKDFKNQGIDLV